MIIIRLVAFLELIAIRCVGIKQHTYTVLVLYISMLRRLKIVFVLFCTKNEVAYTAQVSCTQNFIFYFKMNHTMILQCT